MDHIHTQTQQHTTAPAIDNNDSFAPTGVGLRDFDNNESFSFDGINPKYVNLMILDIYSILTLIIMQIFNVKEWSIFFCVCCCFVLFCFGTQTYRCIMD